jgi:hypothetical protein
MRRLVLGIFLAACAPAASTPVTTGPSAGLSMSADELRRDLFAFAADSFLGRETGTPSANRAARFLVERLMTLGVEPAGDSLYYQRVPLVRNVFASTTRFGVTTASSTIPIALGAEVVPIMNLGVGAPLPRRNAEGDVFFAGYGMTTHGRNDFAGINEPGKVIVMLHAAPAGITDSATRVQLESQDEISQRVVRALQLQPAAIILLMTGPTAEFYSQATPDLLRSVAQAPGDQSVSDGQRPLPMVLLGIAKPGSPLLPANWPASDAPQALAGRRFTARIDMRVEPFTAYNVAAIVRGSDPRFNKTYVAYGAHYDHVGILTGTPGDSIANGADDDGSGSVTLLAIAKALKAAPPRRSALLVWHVGEEKGLLGSARFTSNPTVPIDSIIAQINMDMIGRRGGATNKFDSRTQGGTSVDRLFVLGPNAAPNNQSRVLGAIFDTVNARQRYPMELDRTFDTPTHPERYYYRSDHYSYAQKGIPILFVSTGFHEDYHKVSDEPGKIDYPKMARIGSLLVDFGQALGNRDTRPR